MKTVHTSPNGFADVVATGGFFRVRIRVRGQWRLMQPSYTATYKAREAADRSDDRIAANPRVSGMPRR